MASTPIFKNLYKQPLLLATLCLLAFVSIVNGQAFTTYTAQAKHNYPDGGEESVATSYINNFNNKHIQAGFNTTGLLSNADGEIVLECPAPAVTTQPANAITCSGGSAGFVISATNATSYQWQLNTGSGWQDVVDNTWYAGAQTYSLAVVGATAAMDSYQYRCMVTNACGVVTSVVDTLAVQTAAPSIQVTASATTVCNGSLVTFTASASNAGPSPVYQWQVNGVNAGTNSNTYTNNNFANGDVVYCITAVNNACMANAGATSNQIALTVSNGVSPSIKITASRTKVCPSTAILFIASAVNTGANYAYQWLVNGNANGTNIPVFLTKNLANGDVVSCVLTGNPACNAAPSDTSNAIAIAVTAAIKPVVSITANATAVCPGSPVTFTASVVNGGTSPSYQWLVNGYGTNGTANTFTINSLNNGDSVNCVVLPGEGCAAPALATTAVGVKIYPVAPVSISINAPDTAVCAGSVVNFTASTVNGGTAPVLQWLVNGVSVGKNDSAYSSNTFANGDSVKCVLASNATCPMPASDTSNTVAVKIQTPVKESVTIKASDTAVCPGGTVFFNAATANAGSNPSYQWFVNGVISGADTATFTAAHLTSGDTVKCVITGSATCVVSPVDTSNIIAIVVKPFVTPTVTITQSAPGICPGGQVTFTANVINGGQSPLYQWLVDGKSVAANGNTFTSSTITEHDSVNCRVLPDTSCALPGLAGNAARIAIYTLPVVAFKPDSVYVTGSSGGVTLKPISTEPLATYSWWPASGLTSTSDSTPIANPAVNTIYQVAVTSDKGCPGTGHITVFGSKPILMPSAFTPNGDNSNDVFRIPTGVKFNLQEFDVYDRWGSKIFFTRDINQGWDGRLNGALSTPGTYIYMVKGTTLGGEPVFLKGTIVLVR